MASLRVRLATIRYVIRGRKQRQRLSSQRRGTVQSLLKSPVLTVPSPLDTIDDVLLSPLNGVECQPLVARTPVFVSSTQACLKA